MGATIYTGDAIKWAWQYEGPRFHALLCDPPYHLISGNKSVDWDSFKGPNNYGVTNRGKTIKSGRKGFMGKTWDGGDVAFRPETWAAFLNIMLPGAFGMAFASARGWHRLACAIEDAGFVIHPTIFGWAYGSGFPKATRIDTQIDKAAGITEWETNEITYPDGKTRPSQWSADGSNNGWKRPSHEYYKEKGNRQREIPATPLAQSWQGHRYGLQALKPALEPIIVFQRPYEGKPIDCITETGAGAINIDGGRIPGSWERSTPWKNDIRGGDYCNSAGKPPIEFDPQESNPSGRWPANFLLLNDDAAAALDRQSGVLTSGAIKSGRPNGTHFSIGGEIGHRFAAYDIQPDSGGASRFFFRVSEQLDEADPVRYCAKASRSERDAGLDEYDLQPSQRLNAAKVGHSLAGKRRSDGAMQNVSVSYGRNPHPTVKPIALARYLATLLLPPSEYAPRRLFVPFAGVGSEMIGAHQAGWEIIEGVELEDDSADIGRKRIDYWVSKPIQTELFVKSE